MSDAITKHNVLALSTTYENIISWHLHWAVCHLDQGMREIKDRNPDDLPEKIQALIQRTDAEVKISKSNMCTMLDQHYHHVSDAIQMHPKYLEYQDTRTEAIASVADWIVVKVNKEFAKMFGLREEDAVIAIVKKENDDD